MAQASAGRFEVSPWLAGGARRLAAPRRQGARGRHVGDGAGRAPPRAAPRVGFGAVVALAALAIEGRGRGEYVKVVNGRCAEYEGVYPFGEEGTDWPEDMDAQARTWCAKRRWCVGYMRYISDDPVHCDAWCGRPQFCNAIEFSEDDRWVAYVKDEALEALREASGEGVDSPEEAPAPPPAPMDVACGWPHSGSVRLFFGGSDRDVGEAADCHVLHHRRGETLPAEGVFDGVLSEDLDAVPHFTANRSGDPWLFAFDGNEYIGQDLDSGRLGPKLHFLSVFFLSESSRCDGREVCRSPREVNQWGPEETERALPGHVYVDDGTLETRREAFNPYHFTVICGKPDESSFIPQAVVDAMGFATHPLVLSAVHKVLHRAFFHLPDALQPYTRIHPGVLREYVENMYNDPDKNEAMYYKQTFLFLMQDLFRYRYRQRPPQRLQAAACALCDERGRLQRQAAASRASGPSAADTAGAVDIVVCVMSRRSGHGLRAAIRETWGQEVLAAPRAALRFFVGRADGGGPGEGDDVEDSGSEDIVEVDAPEAYNAVTLKAFSMLAWAQAAFPNLRFLVRLDDDVYLRPRLLFAHLERRAAASYLWGNIDHGSNPVRDPEHPHYNSFAQFPDRKHPLFGDIFPPYARGHLWVMSADLLARIVDVWHGELQRHGAGVTLDFAAALPHPDDPALGVTLANLVEDDGVTVNIDDRDLNVFALNPSCNATYLFLHGRAWAVHHVDAEAVRCMWRVDAAGPPVAAAAAAEGERLPLLADLCECSLAVVEEVMEGPDEEPFEYPQDRFNDGG